MAYEPWLGMDCTNDAWLTPMDGGTLGGDWFEWRLRTSDEDFNDPMVPIRLEIKPLTGQNTAWYAAHNPAYLRVVGILPDETYDDANPFLEIDPITPRWDNGGTRVFHITSRTNYVGFRIYVRSWNSVNVDPTDNHTGWSEIRLYGDLTGTLPPPAQNPDGSDMKNPDGSDAMNPGG